MSPFRRLQRQVEKGQNMSAQAMTVAAAFACQDGAVLCADTQLTVPGWFKYPESKITVISKFKCRPFFVYAGDVDFSKMCIERIARKLADVLNPSSASITLPAAAADLLKEEAITIYNQYRKFCQLQLLIALQGKVSVYLYKLSGLSVSPILSYECIGAGASIARSVASVLYESSMQVKETSFVATYALGQAKKHSYGVGGQSQVVMIYRRGSRAPDYDLMTELEANELEKGYESIQLALRPMLLSQANLLGGESQEAEFKRQLQELVKVLRRERKVRGLHAGLYAQKEMEAELEAQEWVVDQDEKEPTNEK